MPSERRVAVEACVGGVQDALLALELGAERLELCANLEVGGLTPDLEDIRRLRDATTAPFMAMIRSRPGDFCYSSSEWRSMLSDAGRALVLGADGIVFGTLTPDGRIDGERVQQMADVVQRIAGKELVFHRAFDETANLNRGWEALKNSSIDRVLTSGGAQTALEGAEILRRLIADSAANGGRPTILVGGGVRAENASEILRRTGARQLHAACTSDDLPSRLDAAKFQSLIRAVRRFGAAAT